MQETTNLHELIEPVGDRLPHIWQQLTYYQDDQHQEQLTLCVPANLTQQAQPHYPVILFAADPHVSRLSALLQLTNKGYAVAILATSELHPTTIASFNSAARFLMLHAWKYQLDSNRLIAMGEGLSAYAAAGAVLATGQQEFNREDVHTLPLNFRACITLAGQFELPHQPALPTLLGKRRLGPFLLLHGTADEQVPLKQSLTFSAFLTEQHVQNDLYQLKDCPHGSDAFFTPYVVDLLAAFIREATKKAKSNGS